MILKAITELQIKEGQWEEQVKILRKVVGDGTVLSIETEKQSILR